MKTLLIIIALFLAMKPVFAQSEFRALESIHVPNDHRSVADEYASAIPPDDVLPGSQASPLRDNVVLIITGIPNQAIDLVVSNAEGVKVKEIHSFTNQKMLSQTHHLTADTYFIVIFVNGTATMMVKAAKGCK